MNEGGNRSRICYPWITHCGEQSVWINSCSGSAFLEAKEICYEDLKKLIAEGKARIFDVRSPEEVANGHIANSVNIPGGSQAL